MQSRFDDERTKANALLDGRLSKVEVAIADYKRKDDEIASQLDSLRKADDRLDNDLKTHVKATDERFQKNAMEHDALRQTDIELRKHTDASIQALDRKSTEARAALRAELVTRFEEDRGVLLSSFRSVEDHVGDSTSRMATSLRLVQEFLALERNEAANHEHRLNELVEQIERQFAPEGTQARDELAQAFFQEAARLHQTFLADRTQVVAMEDALLSYRKGLALRPDNAEMHFQLGKLLVIAQRQSEAEPHFRYYSQNGKNAAQLNELKQLLGG